MKSTKPIEATERLRVGFRPLADLVPYARNARTHSVEQVAQIMASMVEWGWTNPVLADGAGIVAGHGRVLAAARLYEQGKSIRLPNGEDIPPGQVPVIDCTGWTPAQRQAYVIADNKLALNAAWDGDLLRLEVEELQGAGFDAGLLGFTEAELGVVLQGWESDIHPGSKDGENLDPISALLKVHVKHPSDLDSAREVVVSALQERGIAHELG